MWGPGSPREEEAQLSKGVRHFVSRSGLPSNINLSRHIGCGHSGGGAWILPQVGSWRSQCFLGLSIHHHGHSMEDSQEGACFSLSEPEVLHTDSSAPPPISAQPHLPQEVFKQHVSRPRSIRDRQERPHRAMSRGTPTNQEGESRKAWGRDAKKSS